MPPFEVHQKLAAERGRIAAWSPPVEGKSAESRKERKPIGCRCRNRCTKKKSCPCRTANILCSEFCHPPHGCSNNKEDTGTVTVNISKEKDSEKEKNGTIKKKALRACDKVDTLSRKWLNDRVINSAQILLASQFPYLDGLQDPLRNALGGFDIMRGHFVQIMHVNGNHRITVSNLPSTRPNEVCV